MTLKSPDYMSGLFSIFYWSMERMAALGFAPTDLFTIFPSLISIRVGRLLTAKRPASSGCPEVQKDRPVRVDNFHFKIIHINIYRQHFCTLLYIWFVCDLYFKYLKSFNVIRIYIIFKHNTVILSHLNQMIKTGQISKLICPVEYG